MGEDFYNQHQLKNGKTVEIRNGTAEDGLAFSRLLHRCGCETDNLSFGSEDCPYSEDFSRSYLAQLDEAADSVALLAWVEGALVGELTLVAQARRFSHTAELGICVLQDWCAQGIGSLLLETALAWARRGGRLRSIFLAVDRDNQGAIRLYQRFGFVQYGCYEANSYYNGEYHDILLMNLHF